jgi:hypothetical protein
LHLFTTAPADIGLLEGITAQASLHIVATVIGRLVCLDAMAHGPGHPQFDYPAVRRFAPHTFCNDSLGDVPGASNMRKRRRAFSFAFVQETLMAVWNGRQTHFAKMRFNVDTRNFDITRKGEEQ